MTTPVSPISNRLYRRIPSCGADCLDLALHHPNGLPIRNRRHGRLEIGATIFAALILVVSCFAEQATPFTVAGKIFACCASEADGVALKEDAATLRQMAQDAPKAGN